MTNFRWVKNKKVADQPIEVWENLKRIVKFWEKLTSIKTTIFKSLYCCKECCKRLTNIS